ncbi:MAG: ribonuclease R [Succinivibrio sp.]|nr:ribonuclease R [Succinivibrio sp.]
MSAETENIKKLLQAEHAPKGDRSNDFKTALYLVACLYHVEIKGVGNLGLCASLLGQIGFKGDLSRYSIDDYQRVLTELVSDGALVEVKPYQVYAAPGQVKRFNATVRSRPEQDLVNSDEDKIYVFYVSDAKGQDYYLKSHVVLLPGDEAEVCALTGSECAYALRITKKRLCVLGRLMFTGSKSGRTALLTPDEPSLASALSFEFEDAADLGQAKSGSVVIAEIKERSANKCLVRVREVVQDIGSLSNIILMAVLRNEIPSSWPQAALSAAAKVPQSVGPEDLRERRDLRALPLVTIDGEDARDFDDAVYCQVEKGGWRLYVAIADVSYYVRPGTALDREALERCNSCYFPNFVIPMLPEALSNGICSLNPEVDRLCMVCEMHVSFEGKLGEYTFYPAVMCSHARLTYTEAWRMIDKGSAAIEEHEFAVPLVQELHRLYQALLSERLKRGALNVETEELKFIFNEELKITGIEPVVRNDAHKLIEECMIAANVAAASFVAARKKPTLYRVHAAPTLKKLGALLGQLDHLGLHLQNSEAPRPQDYAALSREAASRPDARFVNELLLRSMSKAEYTPENIGHFGLALEKYAHFTSPIRRYADLQLHRVIKSLLQHDGALKDGTGLGARAYSRAELEILGEKCTEREVAADQAEQEVDFELACHYLEQFIGEEFDGTISACTHFGVFVHLDQVGVDGMIYIGNFPEYMEYNDHHQTLESGGGGRVYGPGQKIKVLLAAVNAQEHKIDLLLPSKYESQRLKKTKKREEAYTAKREARAGKQAQSKAGKARSTANHADTAAAQQSLLDRLADIARPVRAGEEDMIEKPKTSQHWGQELSAPDNYANPLKIPAAAEIIEADKYERSAKKGKKKRK